MLPLTDSIAPHGLRTGFLYPPCVLHTYEQPRYLALWLDVFDHLGGELRVALERRVRKLLWVLVRLPAKHARPRACRNNAAERTP